MPLKGLGCFSFALRGRPRLGWLLRMRLQRQGRIRSWRGRRFLFYWWRFFITQLSNLGAYEKMTVQQQLILQQKQTGLAMTADARTSIDNRASALLQASGLLLVLVGVVKLPDFVLQPSTFATLALIVAFLAFAGMVALTLITLKPRVFPVPVTDDWDVISTRYLQASEEACYDQVISDLLAAIDMMEAINKRKAAYLKFSMLLFVVQIVGLLTLALTA